MNLKKSQILKMIKQWLKQWNSYNLDEVMELMHEDIIFENWTGAIVKGKNNLQRSWVPWFTNHGYFKFITEDIFVDQKEQKVLISWTLQWPSHEKYFKGKPEIRRGVDVLHLMDGKIYRKYTYSKTTILIDTTQFSLSAYKSNISN